MELKHLVKNKVTKIKTSILEKELVKFQVRIKKHEELIKKNEPILKVLLDEELDRNTKKIKPPYKWHENPVSKIKGELNNSTVAIKKALKKIKLIEAELLDRIITGQT